MGQSAVPEACDPNTQSSSTKDTLYTPTHTSSDSNLPLHTPCKSDLINQTSGTLTRSAGTLSTQTPSNNVLQSAYTHFQSGTSSCGSSHPPKARIENVSVKEGNELEEVVDHSSMVHRLGITLEGRVAEGKRDLNTISSFSTSATQRVSAPDLRLLPIPRSPPVSRQMLDLNRSDPTLNRETLLNSHTVCLRTHLAQHDRLKSHLNRAQSLPPAEVEVLYADVLHPCPAVPYYASVTEVPMSGLPTQTSGKNKNALEERRALSEVRLRVGGAEAWQTSSEIEPLEEEKVKKRSSLFSPRKNRKSGNMSGETQQELGKHKSLWKSVFSGYKKEKKRKEVEGYSRTLPSTTSLDSKKRMPGFRRTSGKKNKKNKTSTVALLLASVNTLLKREKRIETYTVKGKHWDSWTFLFSDLSSMKDLSFSEETDLCCSVVLDRSPLRAQVRTKLFALSILHYFISFQHFFFFLSGWCSINLKLIRSTLRGGEKVRCLKFTQNEPVFVGSLAKFHSVWWNRTDKMRTFFHWGINCLVTVFSAESGGDWPYQVRCSERDHQTGGG